MTRSGPWSDEQIAEFLEASRIPVRLAWNGPSGHPVLVSLWFLPEGGQLWCATQRSASVVSLLERDGRCAYEVSVETPPYYGVRGKATASLHEGRGEEILRRLIARYLPDPTSDFAERLLARAENEVAIAIRPRSLFCWDYRERMADSIS